MPVGRSGGDVKWEMRYVVLELRRRVCAEIHIWALLVNTGYLKALLSTLDFFFF